MDKWSLPLIVFIVTLLAMSIGRLIQLALVAPMKQDASCEDFVGYPGQICPPTHKLEHGDCLCLRETDPYPSVTGRN